MRAPVAAVLLGIAAACINAVPAVAERVELDAVPLVRGGRSVVIATLRDAPAGVDHLSLRLTLPDGVRVRPTALGRPDCVVLCNRDYVAPWHGEQVVREQNLGRSKACYFGAAVGFTPGGCDPRSACSGVTLIDLDLGRGAPIPDGGDLLQCTVEADAALAPGAHPLACSAEVGDASGESTAVTCDSGVLRVTCEGDCDDDGTVTLAEMIRGIGLALGVADAAACAAVDRDRDGRVTIAELVRAKGNLLLGCAEPPSTAVPTATPTPGPVQFAPAAHVPPGPYPAALTLADLDRDGALDLIVALQPDYGTADVKQFPLALLAGRGDGGFADPSRLSMGNTPEGVVAADFDGDGRPDLATANYNVPFTVSVRLAASGGGFSGQVQYAAGSRPAALAAADLDGDGAADLVVANQASGDLSVLYGRGDGGFADEQRLPSCAAEDVLVSDVDGDGLPDVVAAGESAACVLRNRNGLLQPYASLPGPGGGRVAAGDLDGDGRDDLALASRARGVVHVLHNDGAGAFAPGWSATSDGEPSDVAIADLTGDGRGDVVATEYAARAVAIWIGEPGGAFARRHRVSVGPYSLPHELAVGDLDGDGRPDLVTANANTHDVSVLLRR